MGIGIGSREIIPERRQRLFELMVTHQPRPDIGMPDGQVRRGDADERVHKGVARCDILRVVRIVVHIVGHRPIHLAVHLKIVAPLRQIHLRRIQRVHDLVSLRQDAGGNQAERHGTPGIAHLHIIVQAHSHLFTPPCIDHCRVVAVAFVRLKQAIQPLVALLIVGSLCEEILLYVDAVLFLLLKLFAAVEAPVQLFQPVVVLTVSASGKPYRQHRYQKYRK